MIRNGPEPGSKINLYQRAPFVIGGYTQPGGERKHFGALLVGVYQDGKLKFAGRREGSQDCASTATVPAAIPSCARRLFGRPKALNKDG
jgi:hypothetical protein